VIQVYGLKIAVGVGQYTGFPLEIFPAQFLQIDLLEIEGIGEPMLFMIENNAEDIAEIVSRVQ
jgi:hypothetical protein